MRLVKLVVIELIEFGGIGLIGIELVKLIGVELIRIELISACLERYP